MATPVVSAVPAPDATAKVFWVTCEPSGMFEAAAFLAQAFQEHGPDARLESWPADASAGLGVETVTIGSLRLRRQYDMRANEMRLSLSIRVTR